MSQWQQQRAQPAPASPWAAETSAAPPATMADPYAAGDGSGSSSSGGDGFGSEPAQRGALPGRLGRSQAVALKDLRADEVEFIQRAAMKMNVIRWSSFLIGGGLAFRFARRRNPPLSILATLAATTMAGFGGVFAAMPLIVYTARNDLARVKDPEHLKRVMQSAASEIRGGRPGQKASSSSSADPPTGFVYEDLPAPGGNPMSDGFVQDGTAGGGKSRWEQLREGGAASASSAAAQMGSRSSERTPSPMQLQQQPQPSLGRTGAQGSAGSSYVELERERFRQEFERGEQKERRGLI